MNDKDRLQEIKGYVELNTIKNADGDEIEFYAVKAVDFEWLIKQAEKVEQLQQENERLKKENKIHASVVTDYVIEKRNLQQQLQQAQAKAERYKKHLLCIQRHYGLPSEPTDFVPVTVLYEIQMIVSNALKDDES